MLPFVISSMKMRKNWPSLEVTPGSAGGRSGTAGGRYLGCYFWVLPKRSSPKPDQHRKGIIEQESFVKH